MVKLTIKTSVITITIWLGSPFSAPVIGNHFQSQKQSRKKVHNIVFATNEFSFVQSSGIAMLNMII